MFDNTFETFYITNKIPLEVPGTKVIIGVNYHLTIFSEVYLVVVFYSESSTWILTEPRTNFFEQVSRIKYESNIISHYLYSCFIKVEEPLFHS